MKKYLIINICLTLLAGSVTSCSKFLDVSSGHEVLENKLFRDGSGIRIAVNGVYKGLSHVDLYGKNLSWGMISAMGYNYKINSGLGTGMQQAADFNWENVSAEQLSENTWKRAYNVIANANNIIESVEKKDADFFQEGAMEKDLILGEMLGVRALLHFDILRLFAPSYAAGASKVSLPYIDDFSSIISERLERDDFFDKAVADLERSRELLASIDTIQYLRLWRSNQGRYPAAGQMIAEEGIFFQWRAQRMTYYAATVLLSRMYLYKGDLDKAYDYAKQFYDFNLKQNAVRWTAATYGGGVTNVDFVYIKRPDELIFTGSNPENFDNWDAAIQGNTAGFQMGNMEYLFKDDMDDYRYVAFYNRYGDYRYLTWARPRGTTSTALTVINQGPMIPMIRLSEVFHIMIECLLEKGEKDEAIKLLTTVRSNRGAKRPLDASVSIDDLKEELYRDIIKETLTEGQTFFLFKRLNRNIYNGESARIMEPEEWYMPLPLSEMSY